MAAQGHTELVEVVKVPSERPAKGVGWVPRPPPAQNRCFWGRIKTNKEQDETQ